MRLFDQSCNGSRLELNLNVEEALKLISELSSALSNSINKQYGSFNVPVVRIDSELNNKSAHINVIVSKLEK